MRWFQKEPSTIQNYETMYLPISSKGIMTTQPTIKCSKSTIEPLEQGVKYVQSQQ